MTSVTVPSALLPEDGNAEVIVAVATPERVQPHLTIAPAAEADVRHVLPRLVAGRRALESGNEPAEARLVVRRLHPSGVLGSDEHENGAGRGVGAPHVHRLLADARVELDAPPPEGEGLEGLGTLEETELVRIGVETVPAPATAFLTCGRPLVGELDGLLEAAESDVEDDHDLGVLRKVGRGVRADPGELVDRVTLLDQTLEGVLEHVLGAAEHTMDELGRRVLLHRCEHGRGERGILVDQPDELSSEADLGQDTLELDDFTVPESVETRHAYLTVAARLTFRGYFP